MDFMLRYIIVLNALMFALGILNLMSQFNCSWDMATICVLFAACIRAHSAENDNILMFIKVGYSRQLFSIQNEATSKRE